MRRLRLYASLALTGRRPPRHRPRRDLGPHGLRPGRTGSRRLGRGAALLETKGRPSR
ncbi:hypothetical protein ACRAWD_01590 [Caulobacter segnis]